MAYCTTPRKTAPTKRLSKKSPLRSLMKELNWLDHHTLKSLHQGQPDSLVGREEQRASLTKFLTGHMEACTPGALYVYGPPGTGKTACVEHSMCAVQLSVRKIMINCMGVSSDQGVYSRLAAELGVRGKGVAQLQRNLRAHITTSEDMIVIVLDEVDQLGQLVLYNLLEWPSLENSKVILIGIANTRDLMDRLVMLESHNLQPTLLHFPPYTRQEIAAIVNARLGQADGAVFSATAVEFASRKVAATCGDLRAALDMCRIAIGTVEGPVTLSHMAALKDGGRGETKQWPLQHKLVLCSLLFLLKGSVKKDVTMGTLYQEYCDMCQRKGLGCLCEEEFVGVVDILEGRGVVEVAGKNKPFRLRKVRLRLHEDHLRHTISDTTLIDSLML